MASDPYSVLGVSKGASTDDIKKAYRKLAHQYHPDKKGGNEAKFKEVNEAYQVLGDPEKKARYDQFGQYGQTNGGAHYQDFNFNFGGGGGFENIFDMFTGGFGSTGSPRAAEKGEDLHLSVNVAARDLGRKKVYEFEALDACTSCKGTGAEAGRMKECGTCHGAGRVRQAVRTPFGTFAQVAVCATCGGDGQIAEKKCRVCNGGGRIKAKRKLELHIPSELTDRYLVAFPREGNAGLQGSPAGDLLVTLRFQ
ncbi:MAG TPA: DnaJ domain-containing protein [Candidatus Paceibacterota bacterium]|nr:DnaJ domain-containing protein [Candidatus Paceibacterota bacterium]